MPLSLTLDREQDQEELVELLDRASAELDIEPKHRNAVNKYLGLIKNRDEETYEHSARTCLKGIEVAEFTHIIDPRILYFAGALHDTGKILADPKSLKKKQGFDDQDREELRRHPIDSYKMIVKINDPNARIAAGAVLFHHWFQKNSYPNNFPVSGLYLSRGIQTNILFYARMLSLVDFYDAATFRGNDRFVPGHASFLEPNKVKAALLQHNPDQKYFIEQLYEHRVFR